LTFQYLEPLSELHTVSKPCLEEERNMTASAENTVVLKVEGMTCGHCVARGQKALDAASGVQEATVDLQSGSAEIRFGAETDAAKLIGVVEAAGYNAQAA
jgi:copper chaperone CopZ